MKILVVLIAGFCAVASVGCDANVTGSVNQSSPGNSVTNSNANASLYALDQPVPPITKTASVPANVMWVDTGVVLKKGERFMIQAEGEWSYGKESVSALGDIGRLRPDSLVPEAEIGALVAKVGDDAFWIGDRYQASSPASSKLYLSINDVPGSFETNKGWLNVSITYPQPDKTP